MFLGVTRFDSHAQAAGSTSYRLIADLRAAETDLRLSAEARQRLIDEREKREQHLIGLAANAYRRVHGATEIQPLEVTFAPVRARRAVEIYLSDKAFETALPHLRRMLKAFLAAPAVDAHRTIERFTHLVGSSSDIVPPFAQMRALYCYGDPSFNGFGDGRRGNDQASMREGKAVGYHSLTVCAFGA